MTRARASLLSALLPITAVAQNITATVNDPRSHGVLADAFLSLDEAIQLANGTLQTSALSNQERAQLAGIGTLTTISVRAALTPTITCERDLTAVTGVPGGSADVTINGAAPGNGIPLLVATGMNHGIALHTNRAQVRSLAIQGGRAGIYADTTASLTLGVFSIVADCVFSGQSQAGIRLRTPSDQPGRRVLTKVRRCRFVALPLGIEVLSDSDLGNVDVEGEWLEFANCTTGVHLASNGAGGRHQWQGFRTNITGGDYCVRLQRLLGNDSEWLVRAVYGDHFARRTAFELDGSAAADTVFHHHQLTVRGGLGSNDYALLTRGNDARFDLHASENVFAGNVLLQSGRLSRRTWFVGNRFENGTWTLRNDGVRPELQWNEWVATAITVLAASTQALSFLDCEFTRSAINDTTPRGVTTLTGCFLAASPVSANVVVVNAAPTGWSAHASVRPFDPPRGGFVDLTADLHPGTAGVWWLGPSEPRPVTTNYPFRYYLNVATAVVLPVLLLGQSTVRVNIPNAPYLAGVELHAQPVIAQIGGQTWGPAIALPRGGRFLIQ
jgi:hypothetical protein